MDTFDVDAPGETAAEGIVTDAVGRAARAVTERLETEARAAWRAGYDFLHVKPSRDETRDFAVAYRIHPSNSPERTGWTTYDLRDLDGLLLDE